MKHTILFSFVCLVVAFSFVIPVNAVSSSTLIISKDINLTLPTATPTPTPKTFDVSNIKLNVTLRALPSSTPTVSPINTPPVIPTDSDQNIKKEASSTTENVSPSPSIAVNQKTSDQPVISKDNIIFGLLGLLFLIIVLPKVQALIKRFSQKKQEHE